MSGVATDNRTEVTLTHQQLPPKIEDGEYALETLADILSTPSGWSVNHSSPPRWEDDPDGDEEVTIAGEGVFDTGKQSHSQLPVSGIQVSIKDIGKRSNPFYQTCYTLLRNGYEISTRSLVRTSCLSEAIEWAERLIEAVENTPTDWVMVDPGTFELNRWVTLSGDQQVSLWQEDRNFPEARKYYVTTTERPEGYNPSRTRIEDNLCTNDLYNSVTYLLRDHSNA